MDPALVVADVVSGYGDMTVLYGVSFAVMAGETVAIAGGNGAGKSTLLGSISGLVRPTTQGTVELYGQPIHELPGHQIARAGLIHVLERRRLAPFMSVDENLKISQVALPYSDRRAWRSRLERYTDEVPLLRSHRHHFANQLSGGQQQIVAVIRGLLAAPKVLLLDEPFQGLDLRIGDELVKILNEAKAAYGTTIVLTEHRNEIADQLQARTLKLERGVIVEDFAASQDLRVTS